MLSHAAGRNARFLVQGRRRKSDGLHAKEMERVEGAAYLLVLCFELEGFGLRNSPERLN